MLHLHGHAKLVFPSLKAQQGPQVAIATAVVRVVACHRRPFISAGIRPAVGQMTVSSHHHLVLLYIVQGAG
jgi:hypothetical protein